LLPSLAISTAMLAPEHSHCSPALGEGTGGRISAPL
jgi:hypothetical protein